MSKFNSLPGVLKQVCLGILVAGSVAEMAVAAPSISPPSSPASYNSLFGRWGVYNQPTGIYADSVAPNAITTPLLQYTSGTPILETTIRQGDSSAERCVNLTPASGKLTWNGGVATGWADLFALELKPAGQLLDFQNSVLRVNFTTQAAIFATKSGAGAFQDGIYFSCTVIQGANRQPCSNTTTYPFLIKSIAYPTFPPANVNDNKLTQYVNYEGFATIKNDSTNPRVEIKVGYNGVATSNFLNANAAGGQVCFSELSISAGQQLNELQ
jgi:hypothetical protein